MPMANLVARKTITTIQSGSVYKERWVLPDEQPSGTTVRIVFLDSAGGELVQFPGTVDRFTLQFNEPYNSVDIVPNGAGFYVYVQRPDDDETDEHMVRYGSVFRRELTFPNSPSTAVSTVVRQFEDSFQRPPGAVGGRWKVLIGRPVIFDNVDWFGLGEDHPNTVGPQYAFYSRYFMYYYQPFNDDTVEMSVSLTRKGTGKTIVTLAQNSAASSFLYVGFNGNNTVELGYGNAPDIGNVFTPTGALEPQIEPVALTLPGNSGLGTYKIRYDDVTKKLGFYNEDKTVKYCEWEDDEDVVPHGKGYRYFGVAGNSNITDSGAQVAYIKAQGAV